MVLRTEITDGSGNDYKAQVTKYNQLVTAPVDYSQAYAVTASVINTAYNYVPPVQGKRFVVTDILLYANKDVGVNDATVDLYEADGATETTVTKSVLSLEMLKQTTITLTGLNMIVSEGKWLNLKTDDNTIFSTVMGYYVSGS
jgi:hypothetical protein